MWKWPSEVMRRSLKSRAGQAMVSGKRVGWRVPVRLNSALPVVERNVAAPISTSRIE